MVLLNDGHGGVRSSAERRWLRVLGTLNEAQARWFVADKALDLGRGGVTHLSALIGMSRTTITKAVAELGGNTQIVLSLIESFEKDKGIEAACAMIDWDEREVSVSEGRTIQFKNEMLVSALRVVEMDVAPSGVAQSADAFSAQAREIRDSFDAFFDFFDKLYALQKSGLLDFTDYFYFYYWLELLDGMGSYKKNQAIKAALDRYIIAYRFEGVAELLEQYRRTPAAQRAILSRSGTGPGALTSLRPK